MPLICPLCSYEKTAHLNLNFSQFLKHIELIHSHSPSFSITCGLDGCAQTFHNFKVFRNHAYSFHGGGSNLSSVVPVLDDEDHSGVSDDDGEECGCIVPSDDTRTPIASNQNLETLQMSSALFLMGTKEKFKITQVALQGIITGITSLMKGRLSTLHAQIQSILPNNLPRTIVDDLDALFSDDGQFCCPFFGLETQHQQLMFYRTHFNLIVSRLA